MLKYYSISECTLTGLQCRVQKQAQGQVSVDDLSSLVWQHGRWCTRVKSPVRGGTDSADVQDHAKVCCRSVDACCAHLLNALTLN